MNVEELLRTRLSEALGTLDPGPGDRPDAERRGVRLRHRRRVATAGGVVALAAAVAVGVLVRPGDGGQRVPEPAPAVGGTWRELSPMPLSPRWSPLAVWTGDEVLVLGGGIDPPCPPNADCAGPPDEMARDGAAYDPATNTWHRIADAPVDIGYWYRAVFVAGELVILGDDRWWAYDPGRDAWHELPAPRQQVRDTGTLATSEDGFVFVLSRSGALWALNVAREHWAQVPQGSPDGFRRSTVVVGDAIMFSGELDGADGHVVVDLGRGGGPLVETGQSGTFQHWTGRRLVNLDLQVSSDGTPYGGRLDPETEEWTPLPDAPDLDADRGDGWTPWAADGPLMAGWGYAYDDRTGVWTTLGRPAGARVDGQQAAVWADGRLLVFGGLDDETGYQDVSGLSKDAWAWTP